MNRKLTGLIMVMALVGGLMVVMAGVAFANPVAWDLDSSGNGTEASPYIMNHQDAGISESGSFTIARNTTIYIISNAPNINITQFPNLGGTDWQLFLHTTGTSTTHLNVALGSWSGGTWDPNGLVNGGCTSINPTWNSLQDVGSFDFDMGGSGTVAANQWMCIQITNDNTAAVTVVTEDVGANSYLNYYGVENPLWPTPEIVTIVLVAVGLMGFGGYIWYRRRKAQVAPIVV